MKVSLETIYYAIFSVLLYVILYFIDSSMVPAVSSETLILILQLIFTPLSGGVWWFITAYIMLMLIAPLLNRYLSLLNCKGYLVAIVFVWFFEYSLGALGASFEILFKGIFYYMLGGFIKLYSNDMPVFFKKKSICAVVTILFLGAHTFSQYIIGSSEGLLRKVFSLFETAIVVPALVVAITLLFVSIDIGVNKWINKVAKLTPGIYLLHESPLTRSLIWNKILKVNTVQYFSVYFPLYAALSVVGVFVICAILDWVRAKFIEPKMISTSLKIKEKFIGNMKK